MAVDGQQSQARGGAGPARDVQHDPGWTAERGHALPVRLRFFQEFKRRNLARVGILYLIACWVILEPTHVVFHMLDVPEWANRLVIVLMAAGLPLVLLFSWVYEITPEGLKPTAEVDRARSITRETGRRLDRAIIVVLSVAVVYLVADKLWLSRSVRTAPAKGAADQEAATVAPAAVSSPSAKAIEKSIAVLPFLDMSEKKDQEYFSDGLTEELIDRLSHTKDLRVVARTSSFYFKGRQATIGEVANALHVSHVLEGSVRKSGRALRITAQLIRTSDGTHVWSQAYDRKIDDIFVVQNDIAGTVAQALDAALSSGASADEKRTNIDAYTLQLQGFYYYERNHKGDDDRAIEAYQKAIALDPTYALAWTRLGGTYMWQGVVGELPAVDAARKAREALEQALAIDPGSAKAHHFLGVALRDFEWNWDGSELEFRKAIALDPDGHDGAQAREDQLMLAANKTGRFDELLLTMLAQVAQDPLDTDELLNLGNTQFNARQWEQSAATFRKLLDLNAQYAGAQGNLAFALLLSGKNAEALAAADKETDEISKLEVLPCVYWSSGRRADSDAALEELKKKYGDAAAYSIAQIYAWRGDIEAAFRWLDRAYQQRSAGMASVKIDPLLQSLHHDPRYRALLVKMKLAT